MPSPWAPPAVSWMRRRLRARQGRGGGRSYSSRCFRGASADDFLERTGAGHRRFSLQSTRPQPPPDSRRRQRDSRAVPRSKRSAVIRGPRLGDPLASFAGLAGETFQGAAAPAPWMPEPTDDEAQPFRAAVPNALLVPQGEERIDSRRAARVNRALRIRGARAGREQLDEHGPATKPPMCAR